MNFNRRGFLVTLLGSGFMALSPDAFASAPDRYKRLIGLALQMKADTDQYFAKLEEAIGRQSFRLFAPQRDALAVQADHLMIWTMENFPGPVNDDTQQRLRDILIGEIKIDVLDEEELRQLEDPIINIVLVKTMITKWKTPCDVRTGTMDRLGERYRDLLISTNYRK